MARGDPVLSEKMKAALLHWFNTFGSGGCGGRKVESMVDLWKEHVPALLLYLKSECKNLKGVEGSSALQVYEEAMAYMNSSTESQHMAANLDATEAANGSELEISKFLLLFWHELCISDKQTIENSIHFMEQVNLQHTMGDAIQWMNNATDNQDYSRWYFVLFESHVKEEELEDIGEAKTPVDAGDARTPKSASTDESVERRGEDTFTFTTPSNIPMRHSFYETSTRNSLMVTPRLSARRQLSVPSSEPRHFVAPHLPLSRGSPIAEQLNSPAMREKRREREMRTLQNKMSLAQEERDAKEMEVKELKKSMNELLDSNHQLKSKLDDKTRDLTKESRLRDEMEMEMEGLLKEKTALVKRNDDLLSRYEKLQCHLEQSVAEGGRDTQRIAELETSMAGRAREIVDLKDEVEAKRKILDDTRELAQKLEKERNEMKREIDSLNESMNEMNNDWRERMKKKENELLDIEWSHHQSMGEMNGQVMEKDAKLKEVMEELEKEKKKGEEWKKKSDEQMRRMREDMEKENRRMIEEMKEKKEKLDRLEEEREKMDMESGEKTRELMKKINELDVKLVESEGCNISLKQKLSAATSTGEIISQEADDLRAKNEALHRQSEQLKETIGEMEEDRVAKEGIISRMRLVEEENGKLLAKMDKLMKEKEEASEKAYAALLENDKFTAMIEKMRREEEERIKEEEWNATILRSEITTANRDKEQAEEKLKYALRETQEERRMKEEITATASTLEEELKNQQFIHKNEMKKLKGLEKELKKNEDMKTHNEEMKERVERLEKELENMRVTGKENMENVVGKKKELEKEMHKKDNIIDALNQEIASLKESRMMHDTSMTTVKESVRGVLHPQKTLMDFDEEPTQLYSKSNLSTMKEKDKDYMEVSGMETPRVMERIPEDKENDTMFMMTPANDRRQLAAFDSKQRLLDIANRNAKTLPHLRSTHAMEPLSPNFSQEGLREGVVRPSSTKKLSNTIRSKFGLKK